jgi:GT2 family glycosyltransferase
MNARPASHPLVSILIVNWKSGALVRRAIASLLRREKTVPLEIIVVDNSPEDPGLDGLTDEFPGVRVLPSPGNPGFAKANNLGAAAARGEFLLLFNSDCVATAEALPLCLERWRAGGESILGCRLANPDGSLQAHAADFPSLGRWLLETFGYTGLWTRLDRARFAQTDEMRLDWITGAWLFTSARVYSALGGLPETYFMYGEDMDFCRRGAQRDIFCYRLALEAAMHEGGGTLGHASPRCLELTDAARIRYMAAWHGGLSAWALRFIFLWRSGLRAMAFHVGAKLTGSADLAKKASTHRHGMACLLRPGRAVA